jgi:hypothetical protein
MTDGEKKPGVFFLSFVEEYWQGQAPHSVVGRIEVIDPDKDYADEEIRFGTCNLDKYSAFRERWDFKEVSQDELDLIRKEAERL